MVVCMVSAFVYPQAYFPICDGWFTQSASWFCFVLFFFFFLFIYYVLYIMTYVLFASTGLDVQLSALKKYVPTIWKQSLVGSSIWAVSTANAGTWREAELKSWDEKAGVVQVKVVKSCLSVVAGSCSLLIHHTIQMDRLTIFHYVVLTPYHLLKCIYGLQLFVSFILNMQLMMGSL